MVVITLAYHYYCTVWGSNPWGANPRVCIGSLQVLQLPPKVQKSTSGFLWTGSSKCPVVVCGRLSSRWPCGRSLLHPGWSRLAPNPHLIVGGATTPPSWLVLTLCQCLICDTRKWHILGSLGYLKKVTELLMKYRFFFCFKYNFFKLKSLTAKQEFTIMSI